MVELTQDLRRALERAPDEWSWQFWPDIDLINDGLIEIAQSPPGRLATYLIRRTPAGRSILEKGEGDG